MYKETIVIAGLGSELCHIDQESMVIMHLKDNYSDELPAMISEKLACITRDVSHTDKQVAITEEEQKNFREFLHCHYWDNDFKMGLVYTEDQESTWKNINGNRNNLPWNLEKYPKGWEWLEHVPYEDMDWVTDVIAQIADNTDAYTAYEEGGRLALAKFIDEDQGHNPLSGIEHGTLYQLAKIHGVKSEQQDSDNLKAYAKDLKKMFNYYLNKALK